MMFDFFSFEVRKIVVAHLETLFLYLRVLTLKYKKRVKKKNKKKEQANKQNRKLKNWKKKKKKKHLWRRQLKLEG